MFTKDAIEKYFFAEKHAGLMLAIIGLMAIITALIFLLQFKTQWYKGFAIPILIVGIIHFSTGYIVYKNCDDARKRMVYAYDMNTDELKNNEIPRIDRLTNNFILYQYISVAILLIGATLFFYFRLDTNKVFWVGLGLALVLEAGISFGFNYFSEKKAVSYLKGLHSFIESSKK